MVVNMGIITTLVGTMEADYKPDCFLYARSRRTHRKVMTAVIRRMRRPTVPAVPPNTWGNVLPCLEEAGKYKMI